MLFTPYACVLFYICELEWVLFSTGFTKVSQGSYCEWSHILTWLVVHRSTWIASKTRYFSWNSDGMMQLLGAAVFKKADNRLWSTTWSKVSHSNQSIRNNSVFVTSCTALYRHCKEWEHSTKKIVIVQHLLGHWGS